jgi:chitodextrinase
VYHYRVRSADALGNVGFSDDQTALIPDVTPPTTPGSFTATAASPIKINLAWGASTDNVKVSEYRVYRNSQLITTTTSRSYADNNLQPNTTYTYGVEAVDSSGNVSGRASVNGTTQADTTLPSVSISAPASGATVSGTSVTITATASDNVAVAGVQFQIDGVNVGAEVTAAPYTITWNSTTVTNATHSVTAVARDTSGNTKISSGRNIKVRN